MKLEELAAGARLLVLDVDGVLSNGLLLYGNNGEELKSFHIADGLGIKLLMNDGVAVAIITGRKSKIVERRAAELGIQHLVQGREDKLIALTSLAQELDIPLQKIAYMGDDLPDLGAIEAVGLGMTVANADSFVRQHADWQSEADGGAGAVREACEFILQCRGNLTQIRESYRA
jgi:3-deoxy-D-manno-octulosonate 8-phosphate phosphatase (KDO 8-P phosphatase)